MNRNPCPHCGWPHNGKVSLPTNPVVAAALTEVCRVFNIDEVDAVGRKQTQQIVEARQLVFALVRMRVRMTLDEVGRQLGGRDHTTVLHGVRQTKVRIETDPQFRSIVMANWPAMVNAMKSKAGAA